MVEVVSTDMLVWLHERIADRELVGGKGASLSQLAALAAPVPRAFALTTHLYREFAAQERLPVRASDVVDDELPGIRARITGAELSDSVRGVLERGYHAIQASCSTPRPLAVRSSATAEDSAEFSFAGLHDTILDVRDFPHFESAVKKCWASLWSERAVTYRREGGFHSDESAIAVVVQELVQSDVSFVVFTVDPVSEHDQHTVIAATWGLGESVVSGLVVPDHIVIGPDGDVIDYSIGDKHVMIIPGGSVGEGSREVPVPRALRMLPVMTGEQASTVGRMARDLSHRLGFRADLEGAITGGEIFLFQARPITTLGATKRIGNGLQSGSI